MLPPEERDAGDAVLLGRIVRAIGHEAVLDVLAPRFDREAGGVDRRPEAVALHGAPDAGRPQGGVAGDALRELMLGDDVGERQATARTQRASGGREHGGLVGGEIEYAVGDDAVDAGVLDRRRLDVALAKLAL